MFRGRVNHIHFVGIGGIGMSGIAEILLNLGYKVSGSDLKSGDITERLKSLGAQIYPPPHNINYIKGADVVVISSAVKNNNPELIAARQAGVPVIARAEMLAELMRLKNSVAIAGSHGKTTTTSLISTILNYAKMDPTVIIGGKLNSLGSNARLGQSELLVAEADESDGSFLKLFPTWVVVTNIDPEHLDYYKNLENLKQSFINFINSIPFYGLAAICTDHPVVQSIIPHIERRFVTYGTNSLANFRATSIKQQGLDISFKVSFNNKEKGEVILHQPGIHNVLNSLASIVICEEIGVDFNTIVKGLGEFRGVQRRFTIKGEVNGITIVDDYGHHPEEIKATLQAACDVYASNGNSRRRIIVVFQPHRYTRTKYLFENFLTAFNKADCVLITDIYEAGESPIEGINSKNIVEGIKNYGHRDVFYTPGHKDAFQKLKEIARPGDVVITLGAGDIWKIGEDFLKDLRV